MTLPPSPCCGLIFFTLPVIINLDLFTHLEVVALFFHLFFSLNVLYDTLCSTFHNRKRLDEILLSILHVILLNGKKERQPNTTEWKIAKKQAKPNQIKMVKERSELVRRQCAGAFVNSKNQFIYKKDKKKTMCQQHNATHPTTNLLDLWIFNLTKATTSRTYCATKRLFVVNLSLFDKYDFNFKLMCSRSKTQCILQHTD